MNRCVAIHSNGTSEVIDVQPDVHRELRGLGYQRFVVRTADGRSLSSAVYARSTPTQWQIGDAARKLWGRNTGAVHVFDEDGEPVPSASSSRGGSGKLRTEPPISEGMKAPGATEDPADPGEVTDPRAITPAMLDDVRQAASAIRSALDQRPTPLNQAYELRALADRLESHARTLETLLPR